MDTQPSTDGNDTPATDHPRWALLRDLAVFQLKLIVDGLRDLVMSPISIGIGIAGLLLDPNDPGRLFRRLLAFGRRSEGWINLFGRPRRFGGGQRIDDLFEQMEQQIVSHYEQGGATATAKDAVDRSLDRLSASIEQMRRRFGEGPARPGADAPADHVEHSTDQRSTDS